MSRTRLPQHYRIIETLVDEIPFADASVSISAKEMNGMPWWFVWVQVKLHPEADAAAGDMASLEGAALEVAKTGESLVEAMDKVYLALKEGLGL